MEEVKFQAHAIFGNPKRTMFFAVKHEDSIKVNTEKVQVQLVKQEPSTGEWLFQDNSPMLYQLEGWDEVPTGYKTGILI